MTKYQVVKAAELDAEKLTFEDLRCHFGTGRSYVISGTGRDRKTGYRTGVQTDVGDIEVSEWNNGSHHRCCDLRCRHHRRFDCKRRVQKAFPEGRHCLRTI